jgi:hypothetical protein
MTPEKIKQITSLARSNFNRNYKLGMSVFEIKNLINDCLKIIRLIGEKEEVDKAIKSFNEEYGFVN